MDLGEPFDCSISGLACAPRYIHTSIVEVLHFETEPPTETNLPNRDIPGWFVLFPIHLLLPTSSHPLSPIPSASAPTQPRKQPGNHPHNPHPHRTLPDDVVPAESRQGAQSRPRTAAVPTRWLDSRNHTGTISKLTLSSQAAGLSFRLQSTTRVAVLRCGRSGCRFPRSLGRSLPRYRCPGPEGSVGSSR